MDIINRFPKDKATRFGDIKLTVTEKAKTNTILNAKVILTTEDDESPSEIKIHKPSDKKSKQQQKKRKFTGQDYETVERMKGVITDILDDFSSGQSV